MKEEMRQAAWLMLAEADAHAEVAEIVRCEAEWGGSDRTALAALSKWTSPNGRALPMYAAAIIVRVCVPKGARDRLTPLWNREAFAAAEAADRPRRAPMSRVRAGKHRAKRA